jgi:3-oxoacyl-[acyl-carrier-protein] synthase II
MMGEPVRITGIGALTALGTAHDELRQGLRRGARGITVKVPTQPGFPGACGFVPSFDAQQYVNRKALRMMTRQVVLGVCSAIMGVRDANLGEEGLASDAAGNGVIYGAGMGHSIANSEAPFLAAADPDGRIDYEKLGTTTYRMLPALWILPRMPNTTSGQISILMGIKGINLSVVNGPSSGIVAVVEAADTIASGRAHRVVCGGSEWPPMPDFVFDLVDRGVASVSERGGRAFNPASEGFIVSEAGVSLVLESAAASRGRSAYGIVAGTASRYAPACNAGAGSTLREV